MNYIGSKHRLTGFIKKSIQDVTGNTREMTFAEIFGGTGAISRSLKKDVKRVIANDLEPYSYVLLRNYIGNHRPMEAEQLIAKVNALEPGKGFIYSNYCYGSGSGRQYFSDENGMKIDAIRMQVEEWKEYEQITSGEYFFLLASLIESADKVANTASVYGAFLKKLKKTAQRPLRIEPANFEYNDHEHEVYNEDANQLISRISGDILYLDPPYNSRQYGCNYHILNTIALYDKFAPVGITGVRPYNRSLYCKRKKVRNTFEDLIREARFRYIFLSYNNEGLMPVSDVIAIMSKYGHYDLLTTNYKRFKADSDQNRTHKAARTTEYLHILEKR